MTIYLWTLVIMTVISAIVSVILFCLKNKHDKRMR